MIVIYGPANLFNDSLNYVLAEELRMRVVYSSELEDIRSASVSTRPNEPVLFLLDGSNGTHENAIVSLAEVGTRADSPRIVAVYNLPRGKKITSRYVRSGVRGLFYHEDTVSSLLKGIRALLAGDTWLSHATLLDLVLEEPGASLSEAVSDSGLTKREVQILAHLSTGETNEEISESLGVSVHTIKSHLYNIYRKINVTNRFQASLWASKHIR